ncbi:hypothetical protein D3C85_1702310 [compost metagenome]
MRYSTDICAVTTETRACSEITKPSALSAKVARKPPCAMPCMLPWAGLTRSASTLSASRR